MFEQLKAIRPAAVINKRGGLHAIDVSGNAYGVLEGFGVLTRLNAYAGERL